MLLALPLTHPCVCGEQATASLMLVFSYGSSLRVRGTAAYGVDGVLEARVIPACAGNGQDFPRCSFPNTGHPCVCGEQTV